MLKKFKAFAGEPAPFVMELPAYHVPSAGNVLRATWERGWSFIKRAGTIILLSSIVIWFLQGFGFEGGAFGMVEEQDNSLLAAIGSALCFIFTPLGFGNWRATVATITGLVAKEEVVNTFGILYHFGGELSEAGDEIWSLVAADYTAVSAYSFLIFNLLCAPCFAAMGAIKREMNNVKWTLGAIGYMCLWAYVLALIVYQIGGLVTGELTFGQCWPSLWPWPSVPCGSPTSPADTVPEIAAPAADATEAAAPNNQIGVNAGKETRQREAVRVSFPL